MSSYIYCMTDVDANLFLEEKNHLQAAVIIANGYPSKHELYFTFDYKIRKFIE